MIDFSAIQLHRANSREQHVAVAKNPDIIGTEIDVFCGDTIPGLFLGHFYDWDEIEFNLAKHARNPFLLNLSDVLGEFPNTELVLDFIGRTPFFHYKNYQQYVNKLNKHAVPFYIFPGENPEVAMPVRDKNPMTRFQWFLCRPPNFLIRQHSINGFEPSDLDSFFVKEAHISDIVKDDCVSKSKLELISSRMKHVRHLTVGNVKPDNIGLVCRGLTQIVKSCPDKFMLERVTFSANQPEAVAKALLSLGKGLFRHHITRQAVPEVFHLSQTMAVGVSA